MTRDGPGGRGRERSAFHREQTWHRLPGQIHPYIKFKSGVMKSEIQALLQFNTIRAALQRHAPSSPPAILDLGQHFALWDRICFFFFFCCYDFLLFFYCFAKLFHHSPSLRPSSLDYTTILFWQQVCRAVIWLTTSSIQGVVCSCVVPSTSNTISKLRGWNFFMIFTMIWKTRLGIF